jgi:hypothetical protein
MLEGLVFHGDFFDVLYSDRRYIDIRILARINDFVKLLGVCQIWGEYGVHLFCPRTDIPSNNFSFVAELQAVMVEGVADPGAAQAKGSKALIILQPETLILENVNLTQIPRQVPGKGVNFATFLNVLNDDGQVLTSFSIKAS